MNSYDICKQLYEYEPYMKQCCGSHAKPLYKGMEHLTTDNPCDIIPYLNTTLKVANFDNKYLFISFNTELCFNNIVIHEHNNAFIYNNHSYAVMILRDNKLYTIDLELCHWNRFIIPNSILECGYPKDRLMQLYKDDILIFIGDNYIINCDSKYMDFMSGLNELIHVFRHMDTSNDCIVYINKK